MPAGTPASKKATPRAAANAAASQLAAGSAPAAAGFKATTGAAPAAAASKSAASGTDKKIAATTGGSSAAATHATPKSSAAMKTSRKSAEGSPTAGRRISNSSTGTSGSVEKSTKGTKTGGTPRAVATTQKQAALAVLAKDTSAKKESSSVGEQQSPPVLAVAPASDKATSPAAYPVAVDADDGNFDVSSSSHAGANENTPQDTADAVPTGRVVEDAPVASNVISANASATPLICILGPPSSGKGTLSNLLKQHLGLQNICTGDLLREAAKEQGEDSEIGELIKCGGLVPDGVVVDLLKKALEGLTNCKGVILDGFPRSAEQVKLMNEATLYPGIVLILKVPSEVLIRRMAARRVDLETGEVFGEGREPRDEEQRQRLVQRDDDKPEILQKRINEYTETAESIISSFTDIGGVAQAEGDNTQRPDTKEQHPDQQQRFRIVDVDGHRDVKQIFEEVSSLLKTSFPTIS